MFGYTPLDEFNNTIDISRVKGKRDAALFFKTSDACHHFKDVSVTLRGSEGDNEPIHCPIATSIMLFITLLTNQSYSAF